MSSASWSRELDVNEGLLFFRRISPDDSERIRLERNVQMEVLRQSAPLSALSQRDYYQNQILPTYGQELPEQALFVLTDRPGGDYLGYGGLVNVDRNNFRAEVSFLLTQELEESESDKGWIFQAFLSKTKLLAFEVLGLGRIFTETFAFRSSHIQHLEAAGFSLEGTLRGHNLISGRRVDSKLHAITKDEYVGP